MCEIVIQPYKLICVLHSAQLLHYKQTVRLHCIKYIQINNKLVIFQWVWCSREAPCASLHLLLLFFTFEFCGQDTFVLCFVSHLHCVIFFLFQLHFLFGSDTYLHVRPWHHSFPFMTVTIIVLLSLTAAPHVFIAAGSPHRNLKASWCHSLDETDTHRLDSLQLTLLK